MELLEIFKECRIYSRSHRIYLGRIGYISGVKEIFMEFYEIFMELLEIFKEYRIYSRSHMRYLRRIGYIQGE